MKEMTWQTVGRYSEWHQARRKGSRVAHHTPGEVSLASWANCWWVMTYVMEKVRLIHWMNSWRVWAGVVYLFVFFVFGFVAHRRVAQTTRMPCCVPLFPGQPLALPPRQHGAPNAVMKRSPIYLASCAATLLGSPRVKLAYTDTS